MVKREQALMMVIEKLKSEKAKATGDQSADKEELEQLRERVDLLLDAQEKMADKLQQQKEIEESLNQQLDDKDCELHETQKVVTSQQELLSDKEKEIAQLKEKDVDTSDVSKELVKTKEQLDTNDKEKKLLTEQNQRTAEENLQLQEDMDQLLTSQKQLQEDNNQLRRQVEELGADMLEIDNQLQEQVKQRNEASQQLEELENQLTAKQKEVDEINEKLDTAIKDKNTFEEKLATADRNLAKNEERKGEEQVKYLDIENLKAQVTDLEAKLKDSEEEVEKYKKQGANLQQDLEEMSDSYEEHVNRIQKELKDSDEQLNVCEEQIAQLKKELGSREPPSSANDDVTELEETVTSLKHELNQSEEVINEMEEEINALKKELRTADDIIAEFEQEVVSLKKQVPAAEEETVQEETVSTSSMPPAVVEEDILSVTVAAIEEAIPDDIADDDVEAEDIDALHERISELERSEEALTLKIELLSSRDASHETDDATESLKKRIEEFEQTELHLKEQLAELERNREQLHDAAREDQDTINELKEQLTKCDVDDKKLTDEINELKVTNDKLLAEVQQVKTNELALNAKIQKIEYKETEMSIELQSAREDFEIEKKSLDRKMSDSQEKHSQLQDKNKELLQRIDELESVELDFQAKVRSLEAAEQRLQDQITDFEVADDKLQVRVRELEAQNDVISERVQQLEQEKSKMAEEVDHLRDEKLDRENEAETVNMLNEKLREVEINKTQLETELKELTDKTKQIQELEAKLSEREEEIVGLQRQQVDLNETIKDLQESKQAGDSSKSQDAKDLKNLTEIHNTTIQAYELQKQNYDDVKHELESLRSKVKTGDVEMKSRASKAIQVKLAEEYSIKNLSQDDIITVDDSSPEFKQAMRNLGARHPEAYDDFAKLLQPAESKASRVHITKTGTDSDVIIASEEPHSERQLWHAVERKRSIGKKEDVVNPQWSAIERNMNDQEEIITVNYDSSLQQQPPPPLPPSQPPTSAAAGTADSADEASEIDDDVIGRKFAAKLRAVSADRDNDFNVDMTSSSSVQRGGNQLAHSLDSIPDDSGYQDGAESRLLRDKISQLEAEVAKRDLQLQELNDTKVKVEALVKVKSELVDAERRIESEKRQRIDKEQEVTSLKAKMDQIQRTRFPMLENGGFGLSPPVDDATSLQHQLDKKEKELNAKHAELEKKQEALADIDQEREQLERQVLELRFQVAEYDAMSLDHEDMQVKVQTLAQQLQDKETRETELLRDNSSLRHRVDALQQDLLVLHEQQKDYKLVKEQYEAMRDVKRKAQTMLVPLRAKVLRLTQQCKARDEMIRRLTSQLRRHDENNDIVRAADLIVAAAAAQDYSRPISPLTSQFITDLEKEIKSTHFSTLPASFKQRAHLRHSNSTGSNQSPRSVHSNSMSPRSTHSTETDDLLDARFINHNNNVVKSRANAKPQPIRAVAARPTHTTLSPVTQLNLAKSEVHLTLHSSPPASAHPSNGAVTSQACVVKSHESHLPNELELPQKPSSVVKHHHKSSFSPTVTSTPAAKMTSQVTTTLNGAIEHVAQVHNEASGLSATVSTSLPVSQHSTPRSTSPVLELPDPPTKFRVSRLIGNDALLLVWNAPHMDGQGRSNGVVVTGYRIFVDNRDQAQLVPSAFMTKALVEHLNLRRPHAFSIQTLGESERVSSLVDARFDDVLTAGHEPLDAGDNSWMSSESSVPAAADGRRRMFIGIYDYEPTKQSPNTNLVKQELAFRMGDIIRVYGDERSDGYYFGKINNKKGLVPASFVEEVAVVRRPKRSSSSSSGVTSSMRHATSANHQQQHFKTNNDDNSSQC